MSTKGLRGKKRKESVKIGSLKSKNSHKLKRV